MYRETSQDTEYRETNGEIESPALYHPDGNEAGAAENASWPCIQSGGFSRSGSVHG